MDRSHSLEFSIRPAAHRDVNQLIGLHVIAGNVAHHQNIPGLTQAAERQRYNAFGTSDQKWQRLHDQIDVMSDTGMVYVAVRGAREVCGFTAPRIEETGRRRVGALYVSLVLQGASVGTCLLRRCLDWHGPEADVYAETGENSRARSLYEKFGFKFVEKVIDYDAERLDVFARQDILIVRAGVAGITPVPLPDVWETTHHHFTQDISRRHVESSITGHRVLQRHRRAGHIVEEDLATGELTSYPIRHGNTQKVGM